MLSSYGSLMIWEKSSQDILKRFLIPYGAEHIGRVVLKCELITTGSLMEHVKGRDSIILILTIIQLALRQLVCGVEMDFRRWHIWLAKMIRI